jgi:adenylate kinase
MRIVLLGAPGSGKGTQGKLLMDEMGIPQVSTGDLLRAAVAAGTELGRKAKAEMDAGHLVDDDIVIGMIHERLAEPDTKNGFILDGFPRTRPQAEALDALLESMQQPLQRVANLEVDNEEIVRRLLARGRADDQEATIRKRLQVYGEQTRPLLDYYRAQHKLVVVRGVGEMSEIYRALVKALS